MQEEDRRLSRALIVLAVVIVASCSKDRPAAKQAPPRDAPPVESAHQICEAGCRAATGCLLGVPTCVADCLADPRVQRCAIAARAGDCTAAATCALQVRCGEAVPAGKGTCRDAATCARDCGGDLGCACRCGVAMDPRHTLVLAQLATCALGCTTELCVTGTCGVRIATCASR